MNYKHPILQTLKASNLFYSFVLLVLEKVSEGRMRRERLVGLFCLLLMLTACNKADEFKDTLDNIPQISNATGYKYKSSYVLGDTITITGILHPDKNLRIEIGNVTATILSMDTIYYGVLNGAGIMQQAHLIITKDMGIGKKRSVVVYNGTNSVTGASINIYDKGGEGSFDNPLQFTDVLPSAGRQNVYLSCINGKGDIY